MKLVVWIIGCAIGLPLGCLIGVSINTIGYEGTMAVVGVMITALLVALCIRMGRGSK